MAIDFRVSSVEEGELDTVFSEDFEFEGLAKFESPILIKGKLKGEIESSSTVYLSKRSSLDVVVACDVINVKGTIKGKVNAKTRIELLKGCTVKADLESNDIIVESGVKFFGTCKIGNFDDNENKSIT